MVVDDSLPHITTDLDVPTDYSHNQLYVELITRILKKILPETFFEAYRQGPTAYDELREILDSLLPLTASTSCEEVPSNISFFVFSKYRANAFKFFFEMISRWLVPGKRLNVLMVYTVDFSMPELSRDVYTLCEVTIRIESQEELEEMQCNLPIIESEVRLGVVSSYYGRRILEVKGLSGDEKIAMIQEYIASIITRLPDNFSYDVFSEMQYVLVMCREDFKASRGIRHLSRIICVQYLFRRALLQAIKESPEKRYLFLKLFRARLRLPEGEKTVLGLLVAVNFLRDKELFEETHLIKAVRNYVPQAQTVKNSFIFNRRGNEPICTLYVEIEKRDGEVFSREEISLLRKELSSDLEGRIEHLMCPVFMPRNEEEIMHNILTLSNQIKYLRDIPQIFISFDEQTHLNLFFTVIIVRLISPGNLSIREMFKKSDTFLDYIHDRCKTIGYLRKKHRKEASVFRVKVPKEQFLRRDHSIDLYKARQIVVSEISRVVGEIRDYNGGMISKQNELLCSVRRLLGDTKNSDDLLLENFFYSLNPVIMRSVLEPEALRKLFEMLLDSISDGFSSDENYGMSIRAEPNFVYVMITAEDRKVEGEIKRTLEKLKLPSTALATSRVNVYTIPCLGYIYRCDDPLKQRQFCISIHHAVESCRHHSD
ncbi:MAG: hypothetical protein K940chlam7_01192 [Chlamydiae bacterium]|nr:hypothetical protein [Chlamydiota bacterium]